MTDSNVERIKRVLAEHAKLAVPADTLPSTADLYTYGMTSHASVNVMLALEDEFDIEFPDELLTRQTFANIVNIAQAIEALEGTS